MKHRAKVVINYRYTPSHKTNIARTIAAEKKRLAAQAAAQAAQEAANAAEAEAKVVAQIGRAPMARRMAGNSEILLYFITSCAVIFLLLALRAFGCTSRWADSGLQSKWGPIQGCLVKMPDGRWIPDDRVRDIDITPKKS